MSKKIKFWKQRRHSPTVPASGLPSSPKDSSNATALPVKQPAASSSDTLHLSCRTLPLNSLIEIDVTGDLRWLIINGNPGIEQLEDAWNGILEEYVSLVKTDKANNLFELYKKIKFTEWQILFIDRCLQTLKVKYDENIAALLGERGFGLVEPNDNREEYLRGVYAVETGAKMLIVLLNQYYAEYANAKGPEDPALKEESAEQKRFRYEKELALLGKYQGKRISKTKTTAFEYAAIINNYLAEQEAIKKANENAGRSGSAI